MAQWACRQQPPIATLASETKTHMLAAIGVSRKWGLARESRFQVRAFPVWRVGHSAGRGAGSSPRGDEPVVAASVRSVLHADA